MGEYSIEELAQVLSDIKTHEEKLNQVIKDYQAERVQITSTLRNLHLILKQNCIDGSGKHEWQPLMFYDYVCKKCEVLK